MLGKLLNLANKIPLLYKRNNRVWGEGYKEALDTSLAFMEFTNRFTSLPNQYL